MSLQFLAMIWVTCAHHWQEIKPHLSTGQAGAGAETRFKRRIYGLHGSDSGDFFDRLPSVQNPRASLQANTS